MNPKVKGASYERSVCKKLSLWVTDGRIEDGLWRSAMSGGRATVALKRGAKIQQVGDICAVRPELHEFTAKFFIECKHVRSLDIESFLLKGKGALAKFWRTASYEAERHGRIPMIIARQNNTPDIVVVPERTLTAPALAAAIPNGAPCEMCLLEPLLKRRYTDAFRLPR